MGKDVEGVAPGPNENTWWGRTEETGDAFSHSSHFFEWEF
jgi:hypothetical protein